VTCDHCDQPWEVASPGRPEVHESGILGACRKSRGREKRHDRNRLAR